MAVDNSLESLLSTLTTSIQSATEALPKDEILPPKEGISLFDVKNELLLSYLQNLAFLILLKLRARSGKAEDANSALSPQDEVVKKLVELRVYLEKGVRPLENRLKYQIDKIVRTADDAARKSTQQAKNPTVRKEKAKAGSGSDDSDADSDGTDQSEEDVDEMTYGPNAQKFNRNKDTSKDQKSSATASKDGIYRPPKITPVSMPTTEGREERQARRPNKSATLDEFVASEMSTAPIAQPSIGSTIVEGGRRMKSEKERREETERRDYEEANFTRLPGLTKKEKAKKGGRRQGGFGGEEWRGIGAGLDRIERLTQKKGGNLGSLGKSRKRPTEDGPRGGGSAIGGAFEKRRKVVERHR
ncbi:hypothetical protein P280DRAFT_378245, partial [Massarina eburnea CBS 473.64]